MSSLGSTYTDVYVCVCLCMHAMAINSTELCVHIHSKMLLLWLLFILETVCNNRDLALDFTITQEIWLNSLRGSRVNAGLDCTGLLYGCDWVLYTIRMNFYFELFLWKQRNTEMDDGIKMQYLWTPTSSASSSSSSENIRHLMAYLCDTFSLFIIWIRLFVVCMLIQFDENHLNLFYLPLNKPNQTKPTKLQPNQCSIF